MGLRATVKKPKRNEIKKAEGRGPRAAATKGAAAGRERPCSRRAGERGREGSVAANGEWAAPSASGR